MTDDVNSEDRERDVVIHSYLAVMPEPDVETLEAWIDRYPQYANSLRLADLFRLRYDVSGNAAHDDASQMEEDALGVGTHAPRLYAMLVQARLQGEAHSPPSATSGAQNVGVAGGENSPVDPAQDVLNGQGGPKSTIASDPPQDLLIGEEPIALADTLARSLWLTRAIATKILDGQIDWDTLPDSVYAETYPYITPLSRARAEGGPIPNQAAPGSEHFYVAVRDDPDMTPEQRTYWLNQSPADFN